MSERPQSNPPTLENLFELKRHERPPQAFWDQFDARLREKQLAALIPVASPWSRWSSVIGRFAKLGLPMAAAAAVAVGLFSLNRERFSSEARDVDGPKAQEHDLAKAAAPASVPLSAETAPMNSAGTVRTVVIEAAPIIAAAGETRTRNSTKYAEQALNAEEITRTIPWLADVRLTGDSSLPGIHLADPLRVEKGPTALAVTAFEESRSKSQPVWAPTEQNIRDAVATEVGLAPSYGDKAQRAWMTRVIAANQPSKYADSRVESEYPREFSRVGLTASTLSIKF